MNKEYNPILYGQGTKNRIISVENIRGQENTVQLFYRDEDDTVRSEYTTFHPFIYINKQDPINDKFYNTTDYTDLFGTNHYNRIVHSDNWSFINWIGKNAEGSYKPYLQAQWMIATGNTQFKGMEFDDPLRFYLDIEVYTSGNHDFPNSDRPEDKIIIITGHDNRGRDYLWRLDEYDSEKEMLLAFIKDFRKVNPDVILGHNCFLEGTKIQMYDGRRANIEEIVESNHLSQVVNINHQYRNYETPSFDLIANKDKTKYKGEIVTLKGNFNTELKTTPEHPHYGIIDGVLDYHEAKDFNVDDLLSIPVQYHSPQTFDKYKPIDYYFAGLMLSDGHIESKTNGMYFSNTDENLLVWVEDYLKEKDVATGRYKNKKHDLFESNSDVYKIMFSSFEIKEMLLDLGVIHGNKSKGNKSTDLSNVYKSNKTCVRAYIAGLIDGDGSFAPNYIVISNYVNSYRDWFVSICKKIGLHTYQSQKGVRIIPTINKKTDIDYILKICKSQKSKDVVYNYDGDRLPFNVVDHIKPFFRKTGKYSVEYYHTKDGQSIYTGLKYDDVDIPTTSINYVLNKRSAPTRKTLYKFIEAIEDRLHKFSDKKRHKWTIEKRRLEKYLSYYWVKIKEKEFEEYDDYVYNFGTSNRNYIANGCLTHNCFGFDLPYIRDRCRMFGIKFALGRDGSEPYTFETSIKFAEKSDEYENFNIYGRHVLDTYFMAKVYDQVARKLESYSLKYCANFLGGIEGDRTYVKGEEISWYWDNKRDELLAYAMDDVYETRLLDKNWGGVIFETTKMFPLPCQDVSRYGTGNKIESLFSRFYYHRLWSYPKPDPKESYGGGYTGIFRFGYISEPSVYIDVSSLYPTVMKLLEIQPPKDELKVFQTILNLVREQRFILKNKMNQEKDPQLKAKYNMEQNAMKLILNSMYGILGFSYGNFNYYKGASLTTRFGREIAKRMNIEIEALGGKVIRTDTDGSLAVVPEEFRGSFDDEMKFIKLVEENLNKWVEKEIKVYATANSEYEAEQKLKQL